jgi:hypothetical protein
MVSDPALVSRRRYATTLTDSVRRRGPAPAGRSIMDITTLTHRRRSVNVLPCERLGGSVSGSSA